MNSANQKLSTTLPEDNKSILASRYKLILPTESQLLAEIKKEFNEKYLKPALEWALSLR